MIKPDPVMNEIQRFFASEILTRSFRFKIKTLRQELGILPSSKSPNILHYLYRLTEDLSKTTSRQEQQRLSLLSSAFIQLKDSSRSQAKRDLVSGTLPIFYNLSNIPEQGNSGSFEHKEIRALAYLGLAAAYHELDDSDELIAEKVTSAIYEDPRTAENFLDPSYFVYFKQILGFFDDTEQFSVDGGIATDAEHGLMWLRFALGQEWVNHKIQGRSTRFTWKEAFAATRQFNEEGGFAGHADWQLPSIAELKTLIDPLAGDAKQGIHFINNTVFPNNYDLFWASSPSNYNDNVAWIVDFTSGSAVYGNINYGYGVRLVRNAS